MLLMMMMMNQRNAYAAYLSYEVPILNPRLSTLSGLGDGRKVMVRMFVERGGVRRACLASWIAG
jgi:hypothetical protein